MADDHSRKLAAEAYVKEKLRPLRKLGEGHYQTQDGHWTFVRDPTGGDHIAGWGYASWLLYDETLGKDEGALTVGGATHHVTLRGLLLALAHGLLVEESEAHD